MRLGTAIEKLVENYNYAVGKEWVQDKVAWALYHTWKEADEHRAKQTEPQTRTDEDGRVWDYRNGNWWQLGKTENNSEKPNNCEVSEIPTGSETQTETSTNDEKLQSGVELKQTEQTDCPWK